MYLVSFIDSGKLVQVSTPSACAALTLQGYLPTARVFKANKLVSEYTLMCAALAQEDRAELAAYKAAYAKYQRTAANVFMSAI